MCTSFFAAYHRDCLHDLYCFHPFRRSIEMKVWDPCQTGNKIRVCVCTSVYVCDDKCLLTQRLNRKSSPTFSNRRHKRGNNFGKKSEKKSHKKEIQTMSRQIRSWFSFKNLLTSGSKMVKWWNHLRLEIQAAWEPTQVLSLVHSSARVDDSIKRNQNVKERLFFFP